MPPTNPYASDFKPSTDKNETRVRQGVLPKRIVRLTAFAIISMSVFACGVICLLAVWDYATHDVAWRALTSLGVVGGTLGAFAFVNEIFGEQAAVND